MTIVVHTPRSKQGAWHAQRGTLDLAGAFIMTSGFKRRPREKTQGAMYLWIAVLIVASGSAAGILYCSFRIHELSIHDRVTVGITRVDVTARLGEPYTIIEANGIGQPPAVGEFAPDRRNVHEVHAYVWGGQMVYVYYDKNDVVVAYYVCQT